MNRDFIKNLTKKPAGAGLTACLRSIFAGIALVLLLSSAAFARGGDPVSPFPLIDSQASKQEATAMATDSGGNIIVAGYTNAGGVNNNYRVVKFRADGSGIAWQALPDFDKSGNDDQATAVAVDSADNVIVSGTVWNAFSTDIHTIKYSGVDGTVLWQHTWSGPGGGADIVTALAVDPDNNIYVAGYTANGSGNDDFLILKYPPIGATPAWVEIWDSPAYHSNDRIKAIAAGTGGLAVTGVSSKGGADFDVLTRKYAFDKTFIWEQRRTSSGSGDDRGVTVGMDPAGNVIVGGYLWNGANNDMLTVKYASSSGDILWEKIYDGGNDDEASTLWVDAEGDIFAAGHTYTYSGLEDFYTVRYGSADGNKVWEKIYNAGTDFTDIPVGIVVKEGDAGDVYVTGYTTTSVNENFTTLKYKKSNGELIWQKSYNGPANKNERPVGIALDGSGNVCVAGWSDTAASFYDFIAIKYDYGAIDPPTRLTAAATSNTSITISWTDNAANETSFKIERKEGESGIYAQIGSVDANITSFDDTGLNSNSYYYYRVRAFNSVDGNSAPSNEAHALTKVVSYDPPGWVYQYNGADNREDEAVAIVTGADNHPVVTGYTDLMEEGVIEGDSWSYDYMTFKLNRADKSTIWRARYDSGDGGTDMAAGVSLDNSGNAIVTGTAYLSGGSDKSDDLYTIKYNSAGYSDPLSNPPMAWGAQYGTQAGIDQATAVQTVKDASNNLVVIGHGINAVPNEDMFIIKYLPDGSEAWPPIVFDGGTDGNDYPSAVAFDAAGDIFITGSTENADVDAENHSIANFDIYTAKYSGSSGTLIWSDIYAGAGGGDDHGLSLAVDRAGDVYVTGHAVNAAGNDEWVTIKYDGDNESTKRRIWPEVRIHNGLAAPVNGNDRAAALALDPIDGDVVVAGTSYRTLTDSDFHLIRYKAADGTVIWERNFDRPLKYDYLTAMAVDSSGYIYLTGNSRSGLDTDTAFDGSSDILSLIYSFEGIFLSASEYNGSLRDESRAIAVNYRGEAFSAGVTLREVTNPDYLVLKHTNNYLLVPAPFAATPQPDYSKMLLTWGANTPGTQFRIERTLAPVLEDSSWDLVTIAPIGTTSHLDSGLATATGYCYRIYAFSGTLDSRTIETCAATTLPATTLNALVVDGTDKITLNWSQVAGNTGYKVERKIGAAGEWVELLPPKAADITTHIDTGLTAGTTYYYRVSVKSTSGYSLPSSEQFAPTIPVAPVLNTPTNITNTQMTLGWNPVTGASGYTLQYKPAGGSYTDFSGCLNTAATSCTVTSLTPDTLYSFQVKAVNSSGASLWSNETSGTAVLAAPTFNYNPLDITTTSMRLGWSDVANAGVTSYTLEKMEGEGGTFGPSGCPQNLNRSCTVYGLTPNRIYYFRVRANNPGGSSAWSPEVSGITPLPVTTITSVAGVSASQIDLSWAPVPEATGYTIQQSACSDSNNPSTCRGTVGTYPAWGNKATGIVPTTYSATGLSAGTNYRYQVIATSSITQSAASNILHAWTWLTAPTLTVNPASTTSLQLGWDTQPGETNYTAEVSTTGIDGAYSPIPAATALAMNTLTYTDNGLALATEYCYKVKAYSTEPTNPPPPVYSTPVCKVTPPSEPVSSLAAAELSSSYTVLQDASKYWGQADYFIGQPVVITSGGNTYTRTIAGSVNGALYVSPPFTSETISQGDSYVILQAVSGTATGNDNGYIRSLIDADKNWSLNEWLNYKIKIIGSVNTNNVGAERTIALNGTTNPYTTADFNTAIVAGDSYQIASSFGKASATGSTTLLINTSNTWGSSNTWTGHYLLMTSGANSGHARKITGKPINSQFTTEPFPAVIASGDSYLIAPPAKMASYFGTATSGSTTQLVDTVHVWNSNYIGSYLLMTSGLNTNNARLITAGFDSGGKLTVSPPFASAIAAGDSYLIVPAAQLIAYAGTAAGSPGTSTTELVDTANSWLTDWTQGYSLQFTSGPNNGQSRSITGKTATTITVSPAFTANISATDSYMILRANATSGSGTVTTTVAPGAAYNGKAKLTLTGSAAQFDNTSPGYANNFNYGLLSLKNLAPLFGDFDTSFDYNIASGLLQSDGSLSHRYLPNTYAAARFDFQSPPGKSYQGQLLRGRAALSDNGRTTAWSTALNTLYDTRTMAGSATAWKDWWATDQWKDYYVQMTSGPNNQLVRKVTANTAGSITLESPFPNDPAAASGTAAASGNSRTRLVDALASSWTVNQWQNYYLHMSSGANAGQTRKIISSDASSVTVEGTGFTETIGAGDSYRMFTPSGDAYRINVIAGNAATHGSTQDGTNSTNAVLVDSSDNTGTTLPPKNWGTNQWAGFHLYLSSGPNIGQFRTITANTANSITVAPPFPYQIASGDSYTIFDPRTEAQVGEAYWVNLYDPVTNASDTRVFPTSDVTGKLRIVRSGSSLSFYTSPATVSWQLRRQLDLSAGDVFTPSYYWIYQLGRLPQTAGTNTKAEVSNFQFALPAGAAAPLDSSYWTPEVGHTFRRLTLKATQAEISWEKISTALEYQVERCPAIDLNQPTVHSGVGTCTTFTQAQPTDGTTRMFSSAANSGLIAGYTYRFRVRAKYNDTDYTAWSNEQWFTVTPPAPVMVKPSINTATTTSLTPTWNNVNGDNGYKLYWKVGGSDGSCSNDNWSGPVIQAINVATYTHTGLTPGTYYCYKITAIGPPLTQDSVFSSIVSQETMPSAPGTITFSGITTSSIILTWPHVTGNYGYRIERSLDNVNWPSSYDTAKDVNSFTNSGLAPGTLYYYRIRAKHPTVNYYSAYSATESTTTTPAAPVITVAVISASQSSISWPLVLGASNYKIERKEGGGSYSQIDNVAVPYSQRYCDSEFPTVACPNLTPITAVYPDNGLSANTTYCYKLLAWNVSGGDSAASSEKCVTTPLLVQSQSLSVTPVNSFVIKLDWVPMTCSPIPCSAPEGFIVERMIRDGIWVEIAIVGPEARSFTDRIAIDPIKQYRYRVRSFNGESVSPYAEGVAYTPPYKTGDNVGP